MNIKEIESKTILSASKIYEYTVNPYIGCQHACSYCYARFMRKFSGHKDGWGKFVDVKINAASLLQVAIEKKRRARVWISGVCDPYQPLEAEYKLTRRCLEILIRNRWPVTIQTRSPLVLRDIDILKNAEGLEVGVSITTADDEIRKLFEPEAPSIIDRLNTLDQLHKTGIRTYAMVAPMLPGAEGLGYALESKVDYILIDRMNYHFADWIYSKYNLRDKLSDQFFNNTAREIASVCDRTGVECRLVF